MLPLLIKGGGRAVLNWARYLERVVKERVRGKNLGSHSFARLYFNFASTAFFTFLDRYSKKTLGSTTPFIDTAQCFDAFSLKFCRDFTCRNLSYSSGHSSIEDEIVPYLSARSLSLLAFVQSSTDVEVLNFHYFEYMKALQEKNLPRDLIDVEFDEFSTIIDFFSKKQAKPDVRDFFERRLKAGQGVSAFKKIINALLAPYSRRLAELLHVILHPNVVFASNISDAQIGARLAELIAESKERGLLPDNFACDFAEYDSSQYSLSPNLNSLMMAAMGAPPKLIDLYRNMRSSWVLCDDMMKLYGHEKMHSGEPFTLVGNTFFGMCVIAFALDFDELVYAAFKGDDSALNATNVRFNNSAMCWCRDRGLQLKDEYPPHMEFAGMFITPFGFYPDVIRKCVKFMSTVFRDLRHYKQAVLNLDADLSCITSSEHAQFGAIACSEYYSFINRTYSSVSAEHVHMLLSWLHRQKSVDYDDLPDFNRDVLTFLHSQPDVFIN
jgi:hypothetical protein